MVERASRRAGSARRRSRPTRRSRSSTRRARPARPRVSCSRTRTSARACCSAVRAINVRRRDDEQYLFLPLAHVLGREIEWAADPGVARTWFSEGMAKIKDNLVEVRPTFMASVPRIYEKFYSGLQAAFAQGSPGKQRLVALGAGRRQGRFGAQAAPASRLGPWLGLKHAIADKLVFSKLRERLGLDRCRFLVSGGAPLSREIAEFFHSVGLLILRGLRADRDGGGRFPQPPGQLPLRHRRAGAGHGPGADRRRRRDPDARARRCSASTTTTRGDRGGGGARRLVPLGDIGVLEDGFLRITDRKKDLIVTAGGRRSRRSRSRTRSRRSRPLSARRWSTATSGLTAWR